MLNEKETNVLVKGIAENCYNYGDCFKPIMVDTVEELFDDEYIVPILRTLEQKGMINVNDEYVWLTTKGKRFYKETCVVAA